MKRNEETKTQVGKRLPTAVKVIYLILLGSAAVFGVCLLSEGFADWLNGTVSCAIRWTLAHLTSWLPFSFAEYCLLMIPVILAALIYVGNKKYAHSWSSVFVFCGSVLSAGALILSIFFLGFGPAYHGRTLDQKLELSRREVSAEELYETAVILAEQVNEEAKRVRYAHADGFSVMPYDVGEMNRLLLEAYDDVCDEYSFVQRMNTRIKPVMISRAMSYTHITGVYSFFTGEANLNVHFPDYTLPYTAAHELSHQRGIAREDEANFMAFLVCIRSEDPYIRYSGYLNLYEYVASALAQASPARYAEVTRMLSPEVLGEMSAFYDFFEPYRDSTASTITDAVNDTFLTLQGTEGTKSYGMVVDLAVAYYGKD